MSLILSGCRNREFEDCSISGCGRLPQCVHAKRCVAKSSNGHNRKLKNMIDIFIARYGSRRGFVKSKWYQLLYYLGRYRHYNVPWSSIDRLVFVCTGNICRSAFAEAVAKKLGIKAISVGIHAIEGAPADRQAISTAEAMGYNLSSHLTTPIMYPEFNRTDLLIAMEPWQAELVSSNLSQKYHTTLLGMWSNPIRPYIHDPYMKSESYFNNCFNYIEKSVHAIAAKLQKSG